MTCAACQAPAGDGLICEGCGAILPARAVSPFAALGLPARFDLADDEIDARYRELSRKLHPDRFAKAPAADRVRSLQAATTLNDSVRLLRKPLARAEALLALDGVIVGENEAVAGEMLADIMELREAVEEARAAGDQAGLRLLVSGVRNRRDRAMREIAELFAAGGDRQIIKTRVIAVRYYDRLLEAGNETPASEGAL